MVQRAVDWPYSSFQRYYASGVYGENWAVADKTDDVGFGE
jgi:hypothetical protein